jgi:hypothetical protein
MSKTLPLRTAWVIPDDYDDLAPLPALVDEDRKIAVYSRRERKFGDFLECDVEVSPFGPAYSTFEECRTAMLNVRTQAYNKTREHARKLAASIEHIKIIPVAEFPSVEQVSEEKAQPEQRIEGESQQGAEGKEKQEEVKPAKAEYKRPIRKS